jgi:Cof subfamily protein (haloacid dehalogenase superfamily)
VDQRKIKGVALDIDGTLLRKGEQVSFEIIAACEELVDAGLWITLMSARPAESIARIARQVGSTGPWGALNGALVVDQQMKIRARASIPETAARRLIACCEGLPGVSTCLYSAFDWYTPVFDQRVANEAEIVDDGPKIGLAGLDPGLVDKVLLMTDPVEVPRVMNALGKFREEVCITVSKPGYIEITNQSAGKGWALTQCALERGLDLSSIAAVGDGENDIDMFRVSGLSAAMFGGSPRVRAAAGIVLEEKENALASFLRTLIPHQRPQRDFGSGH